MLIVLLKWYKYFVKLLFSGILKSSEFNVMFFIRQNVSQIM